MASDRDVEPVREPRDEVTLTTECSSCSMPVPIEAKRCSSCGTRRITAEEASRIRTSGVFLTFTLTLAVAVAMILGVYSPLVTGALLAVGVIGPCLWISGHHRLGEAREERENATERVTGEVLEPEATRPDGRHAGRGGR